MKRKNHSPTNQTFTLMDTLYKIPQQLNPPRWCTIEINFFILYSTNNTNLYVLCVFIFCVFDVVRICWCEIHVYASKPKIRTFTCTWHMHTYTHTCSLCNADGIMEYSIWKIVCYQAQLRVDFECPSTWRVSLSREIFFFTWINVEVLMS